MTERLLRLPEVRARAGLGRSTIYTLIAQNKFPPPIQLGARAVAWLSSEVDTWIAQRIKEARVTGKEA
jgi:prophage regulatory protein